MKCGRMFLIASTTAMVLEPGWRWIASTMARLPLYQLATYLFSTLSIARADILHAHRRAVLVGDDLAVRTATPVLQLPAGMEHDRLLGSR